MGVAGQVVQDILGAPEGRLDVNDPILTVQGADQSPEQLGILEPLWVPIKTQFPLPESRSGHGDERAGSGPKCGEC
jgi:hypothetical protein